MILPDYNRCVLNTAATLLRHYGAPTPYAALPELAGPLAQRPRHVILLVLDGLGAVSLTELLAPGDFLPAHQLTTLTSVLPSTTAAAMNAYYSGLSPAEHGWLGWSCYIKEYARAVDLFLNRDSYTHRPLKPAPAANLMPFEGLMAKVRCATGDEVTTRTIHPFAVPAMYGAREALVAPTFEGMLAQLDAACRAERPSLTLAYWADPDETMHQYGVNSIKAREKVRALDAALASFSRRLQDALLIVSADHGLIDAPRAVFLDEIPEIARCLIMPTTIEPRCASFFVKAWRRAEFCAAFAAHCGDDFVLMERREVLEKGLFGPGEMHPKADDFLGDYLALAVGEATLRYRPVASAPPPKMIGQHAGVTEREMLVPLIARYARLP